ncbi:MAG: hypothetical protein GEU79_05245 [Acidimicrobiia bacterium]|nr:hypothetical protein [Acidimicrobiia bacterium]
MTDFDDTAELDVILPGDVFRRQVLAWDAGFCILVGLTLLAGWMSDRPLDFVESWVTSAGGAATAVWGLILAYSAQGAGGRGTTAFFGLVNLAVAVLLTRLIVDRAAENILAWLLVVIVAGFAVVQFIASVRR